MKKLHSVLSRSGCCVMAAILFAHQANAQTQPADSATAKPVDEIVVTAEKMPTLSRNVAGGVTALDANTLKLNRVDTLEDATRLVPGFEFGKVAAGSLSYPVIRGVAPQLIGDPTVSTLVDGFGFANSASAASAEVFDASTIEVLKGPQATLYGANSLGGVVNIVSKLPSLTKFEGDFRASYGSYDSTLVRGAVSIPLINDKLAIRIGGFIDSRDGYWDNIYNGTKGQDAQREKGARFALHFRPSDVFDSALIYTFDQTKADCGDCSNPIIGYDPANPTAIGAGTIDTHNLGKYTNENIPGYFDRVIHRVTWNNSLDFGGARLTSLTGYGYLRSLTNDDADRGPGDTLPFLPGIAIRDLPASIRYSVFSQELRLASNGSGPLHWQVGGFYQQSIFKNRLDLGTTLLGDLPAINIRERFSNYAIFTQNSYQLTDGLKIELGLRYDHAEKSNTDLATGRKLKTSSNAWLPKVAAVLKLDDNNNLYATVSRGYKTGGINTAPGVPSSYAPEYLWNYEVGLKGVSANRALRYSLSAYYVDWTKQQVTETLGFFGFQANAGKTRIYGAEAALHYDVSEQFSLDASVNYNHSRYVDFIDGSGTPAYYGVSNDRSGQRTFLAPNWSGSVAARYVQPIGGDYDITLNGDARYTGSRALDSSAVLFGKSYILANFALSVGDHQKRLTVFANNAFNKRYELADLLIAGVAPSTHLGTPRVIGVQADFSF